MVRKVIKEGEKVKVSLKKANKESEQESVKKRFRERVGCQLRSYQLKMKHEGISLKNKDLNILDNLAVEICGEEKAENPSEQKNNLPILQEINRRYQNDKQKNTIITSSELKEEKEKQLVEQFLKKIIEAEIYIEKQQSDPQLLGVLLLLEKDYPNIYQLLNKEGRVGRVIKNLEEAEQKEQNQKNNQRPNNNFFLFPALLIGGTVIFLVGLLVIIKGYLRKKKDK